MDGLSLCGSKASFVQGVSSRPVAQLASSKPHVVQPWSGEPIAQEAGGGKRAAWGLRVQRAKATLLQAKKDARCTGVKAKREVSSRPTDAPAPALAALLEGWGDERDSLHRAQPGCDDGAGAAQRASADRRVARDSLFDNAQDKENAHQSSSAIADNEPAQRTIRPSLHVQHKSARTQLACSRGTTKRGGGGPAGATDEQRQQRSRVTHNAGWRLPSCPEPRDSAARRPALGNAGTSHDSRCALSRESTGLAPVVASAVLRMSSQTASHRARSAGDA